MWDSNEIGGMGTGGGRFLPEAQAGPGRLAPLC